MINHGTYVRYPYFNIDYDRGFFFVFGDDNDALPYRILRSFNKPAGIPTQDMEDKAFLLDLWLTNYYLVRL